MLVCVCCHLWECRKPSPDPDVISLIESVPDTMQLCFSRSMAPTSDMSGVVIRLSRSQKSHEVVLCSCNVGARQAGIQRSRSRATQQPADFLSIQGKWRAPPSRCWFCLSPFVSQVLFYDLSKCNILV